MTEKRGRVAVGLEEKEVEQTESEAQPKKLNNRKLNNNVRKIRESLLMSKAELARKSGLSALTIDRVESGYNCRMDTKRKIILALGLRLTDKDRVFIAQEEQEREREV
jgi:DNA-binding XRE family transcriptional regulator